MSLDFSKNADLAPLGRVVVALLAAAEPAGIEFFLMGAAARDVMLRHAHGIDPQRQTEDVDFAIMVGEWNDFESLRSAMIASKAFLPRQGAAAHRLRHMGGAPIDIVPFGGVERPDRTIAWPPDQSEVFDCFGVQEALATCDWVLLPGGARLKVPSIPALALLKILAWRDRKYTHPGHDAVDLVLYLRKWMDCGNYDRAAAEHADLFETPDYDHEEAGARLLARDIAALLDTASTKRVLEILLPEAEKAGPLLLAHQSGLDLERARRLIEVACDEMSEVEIVDHRQHG